MTVFTVLAQLASFAMMVSTSPQESDPLIGAWGGQDSREGRDVEVVVVFTAAHQVAVWFDPESGEVVHTNGGLWSRTGTRVTEVVEFDSDRPARTGTSVSFDIELSDTELSIVGADMQLARIDRSEGDRLQGAWELFEVTTDGDWVSAGSESRSVRLMSATRFQEVEYEADSGQLIGTTGGRYTLDSEGYVETVEFSTSEELPSDRSARYSAERDQQAWWQVDSSGAGRAWGERQSRSP